MAQDVAGVTLSRDARKGMVVKINYDSPVPAPIAKGQKLGPVEITAPGIRHGHRPARRRPATCRKAGVVGRITGA